MDYETKPISRIDLRNIAKYVRKAFKCKSDAETFPVLYALEAIPDLFPNSNVNIIDDTELPANVFACCCPKPNGGFTILIKQSVYDGACYDNNSAFLCFICHEICHIVLFYIGFTPISNMAIDKNNNIPAYRSVEWQAKALCGEVMIPYEATMGMKAKEIAKQYNVTKASAKYRVQQDKKK